MQDRKRTVLSFLSLVGGEDAAYTLPAAVLESVREIRFRCGRPIMLEHKDGRTELPHTVTMEQILDCIRRFCGYSLHSHEKELGEGYITLDEGHRAGFCGTAVLKDGKVETIRDISGINLRIAGAQKDCAAEIYENTSFFRNDFKGLLLIGPPLSGKTTVLRDLCRLLGENHKVCIVDERSEIASVKNGIPQFDVGKNTDVFDGFPKKAGILTALRSLSPQYIACDEIGDDATEIAECLNSGVKVILTAHCSGREELYRSKRFSQVLNSGAVSHVVLLGTGKNIGKPLMFFRTNNTSYTYAGGAT